MKTLPRVTADEVLAAYRETEIIPALDVYIDDEGEGLCGCPLGAIYLAKHPREKRDDLALLYERADDWAEKRYGVEYVIAFTAAFDHGIGNLEPKCIYAEQRAIDGFNDGRAVAFAVLGDSVQ